MKKKLIIISLVSLFLLNSCYVDMEYNSADADRMFVELDIRMTDFKPTTNTEGMNVCSYLAYFYLRPKTDPGQLIWFGLNLFSGASLNAPTNIVPNWSPDSAAHQYMGFSWNGLKMSRLFLLITQGV